jgi:hypothetical protein
MGREGETMTQVAAGGSTVEAIAGVAVVVLAVIGLVSTGDIAFYMMTIGTILAGIAVMVHGAAIGARASSFMGAGDLGAAGGAHLGTGVSAEFLGGAAGIVLGVLALLNMVPLTLVAVAVIVLGGALLMGGGLAPQLSHLESGRSLGVGTRDVTQTASAGSGGAHVLVGLAAVILGIIALRTDNPTILNLVGLLTLGAGIVLSGGALASHLWSTMRR